MINIKIIFLSLLVDITKKKELDFSISENSTIKDVLSLLFIKYGKNLKDKILLSSNSVSKYIILGLNGMDIRSLNNLNTILHEGDELCFLPAIAGG
jgi:MoaD family protein